MGRVGRVVDAVGTVVDWPLTLAEALLGLAVRLWRSRTPIIVRLIFVALAAVVAVALLIYFSFWLLSDPADSSS